MIYDVCTVQRACEQCVSVELIFVTFILFVQWLIVTHNADDLIGRI